MDTVTKAGAHATPWNKGRLLGQKPPLKLKEIWAIRIRLQLDRRSRELALFNLGIDSKLRGCDWVGLRVHDVVRDSQSARRAIVMQKKTQWPVQFELTEQTRDAVAPWIATPHLKPEQYLVPSRMSEFPHVSTRQYSRIVGGWVGSIGLDGATYGTHSLRRIKTTFIYQRTKNLRAVQFLLGHTKLESTVGYLGIEFDDALEIAEQTEVSCCRAVSGRRTRQSLTGQKPSVGLGSPLSRNRSFTGSLLGPRHAAGNDDDRAEQSAMRDEAHRDLGWLRDYTAKPVRPSASPSSKEVVRDSIDIAPYVAQCLASERLNIR